MMYSAFVTFNNKNPTRRNILSIVNSVYDPLGFLVPFVLKAKQILQQLCKDKYGWDGAILVELLEPWQQWLKDLDRFQIIRCGETKKLWPSKNCIIFVTQVNKIMELQVTQGSQMTLKRYILHL